MTIPVLYDYWRSSASYRVRIALNMLGQPYEAVPINLLTEANRSPEHLARNPQGLIPTLEIDGLVLTQSLAIIEYLDETREQAAFLPTDAKARARVRALSYAVAMEIHPLCNSSVGTHIMEVTGNDEALRKAWMQHFIRKGLAAIEVMLDSPETGRFCHGDQPTMADFCLVPQVYNAHRWEADISDLHRIQAIVEACNGIDAFANAHPDVIGPPVG